MDIKLLFFLIFTSLAMIGCASSTAPGAGIAEGKALREQTALAEDDPNRVICRREHVVGSNFTRRVCQTVRQVEEERRASQQKLEQERVRMTQKALPPPRGN